MKITRKQVVTTVVGTVLVVPAMIAGKMAGALLGVGLGVFLAYGAVDVAYDSVTEFLNKKKQEQ